MSKKYLLICLSVVLLLFLVSQRWLFWDEAIELFQAGDAVWFLRQSLSFPNLEVDIMTFHHAQRFIGPVFVGILAQLSGIYPIYWYYIISSFFLIGSFLVLLKCLKHTKSYENIFLFGALYFLNPYTFRYYLLLPGLLPDTIYFFGLSLVFLGLLRGDLKILFCGVLFATIGRQTVYAIVPGMVLWILYEQNWRLKRTAQKIFAILIVSLIPISHFLLTSALFQNKAKNDNNSIAHIIGIFTWAFSGHFDLKLLANLVIRCILPLLIPLLILLKIFLTQKQRLLKIITPQSLALLWAFGLTVLQPILAGPWVTHGGAARLGSHALIPLVMFLSFITDKLELSLFAQAWRFIVILGFLFVSSLYHHSTNWGINTAAAFAVLHVFAAIVIFFTIKPKSPPLVE